MQVDILLYLMDRIIGRIQLLPDRSGRHVQITFYQIHDIGKMPEGIDFPHRLLKILLRLLRRSVHK